MRKRRRKTQEVGEEEPRKENGKGDQEGMVRMKVFCVRDRSQPAE